MWPLPSSQRWTSPQVSAATSERRNPPSDRTDTRARSKWARWAACSGVSVPRPRARGFGAVRRMTDNTSAVRAPDWRWGFAYSDIGCGGSGVFRLYIYLCHNRRWSRRLSPHQQFKPRLNVKYRHWCCGSRHQNWWTRPPRSTPASGWSGSPALPSKMRYGPTWARTGAGPFRRVRRWPPPADQSGDLLATQLAQFQQVGQRRQGYWFSHSGNAAQQVVLLAPHRTPAYRLASSAAKSFSSCSNQAMWDWMRGRTSTTARLRRFFSGERYGNRDR